MSIRFFKYNSAEDAGKDKPPVPVLSGLTFESLIKGKTVEGLGWYGDDRNVAEAHIYFTDSSQIRIRTEDLGSSISYVPILRAK